MIPGLGGVGCCTCVVLFYLLSVGGVESEDGMQVSHNVNHFVYEHPEKDSSILSLLIAFIAQHNR